MEPFTLNVNEFNICRICVQDVKCQVDLFCNQEVSKEILNKIYLCFQIILNFNKCLPSGICSTCIEELDRANSFRLKCITFQEKYAKYCKQITSKHIDEERNEHITSPINENNGDNYSEEICTSDVVTYISESSNVDMSNEQFETYATNTDLNNIKSKFPCDVCNKILKSSKSLLKHKVSMHQNRKHVGKITGFGSSRRYHCTKCAYSTPHSQTLVNHMRRHDGERPYRCECGKTFTQSSSLSAHYKTHSDTTYYTCSVCGKQFKHAYTLKNHLSVHDIGNFPCSICHKILKSKKSLQDHLHRHYNVRNYNCEDCGDTFVTSAELLNHRKKHSPEKRVECHICGYKTRTKKNLIIHLKRHAGDKSYKCELCEVTFYTRGDQQRHQRVHTREKPFACQMCAQRFTHSSSLNKHMHTVHGIKYKWGDFKWKEIRKIKLGTREIIPCADNNF